MKIGTILSLSLIFIMGKAWPSCDTVNSSEPFTKLRGGRWNPYYIFFCHSKPAVSHQLTADDIGTGFKGGTNSRLLGRSVSLGRKGSGDGSLSAIPGTEIDLNGNLDENDLSFLYENKKIVLSDTPVFNFYSRVWSAFFRSCGTATTGEYKYIINYIKGSEGLPFFYSPNTSPENLFVSNSGSVGVDAEGDGLIRIENIQLKSGTNILKGDLIFHIVNRPPIIHGGYRFCRIGLGAKLEINPKNFLNTNPPPGNYTVEVKVKKP